MEPNIVSKNREIYSFFCVSWVLFINYGPRNRVIPYICCIDWKKRGGLAGTWHVCNTLHKRKCEDR